jgi:chromosome segregation ATPase
MEMKSKYLNYIDFELEQKKIENKLEMKYGKDLEEKQRVIDALNKEVNEMIRENEINKSKLSLIQKDHEEKVAVLKGLNKKQIDLLTAELKEYQTHRIFDEFKPRYEEAKIKKEEAERISGMLENEVHLLKADLHNTKVKYNQAIVDHARELEKLRAEGWNFKNEKDKILFRNESLEQENADLKSSFNGYEKKIVELTNEVLDKNKLVAQKEREIEELQRKQLDLENESINKQRGLKQLYEEQASSARLQQAQDSSRQQEEIRALRENANRLEERVKAVLASEQSKDRQLLELERKGGEANDKITALTRQLKEERDKFDRIALDNEGSPA